MIFGRWIAGLRFAPSDEVLSWLRRQIGNRIVTCLLQLLGAFWKLSQKDRDFRTISPLMSNAEFSRQQFIGHVLQATTFRKCRDIIGD